MPRATTIFISLAGRVPLTSDEETATMLWIIPLILWATLFVLIARRDSERIKRRLLAKQPNWEEHAATQRARIAALLIYLPLPLLVVAALVVKDDFGVCWGTLLLLFAPVWWFTGYLVTGA